MNPGIGDRLTSRIVKTGGTYQVIGRDRKHLLTRCVETGVPAKVRRAELDRWEIVFEVGSVG